MLVLETFPLCGPGKSVHARSVVVRRSVQKATTISVIVDNYWTSISLHNAFLVCTNMPNLNLGLCLLPRIDKLDVFVSRSFTDGESIFLSNE